MNKNEIPIVLGYIKGIYPEFFIPVNDLNLKLMIEAWYDMLKDLELSEIKYAIQKHATESPFKISIYDIRTKAIQRKQSQNQISAVEGWNEFYNALSKGSILTQEEFERLHPINKLFIGSIQQIKDMAMMDSITINSVVKGQYLKQFEFLMQREIARQTMPEQLRDKINALSEEKAIKFLN